MIDHIGLTVSNYAAAKQFYSQALAPLGYSMLMEIPVAVTGTVDVAGFGEAGKPDFWINGSSQTTPHVHVAFRAASRAMVDGFYAAALAAGARDNGAPGIRAHYHPDYYGAFVIDPDGHNIEAVCHSPA